MYFEMNICYVCEVDFTRRNATSARILNCARAIEYQSDCKVDFIGFSNTPHSEVEGFTINNVKRGYNTREKVYNTLTRAGQIVELLDKMPTKDVIIYYAVYGHAASILQRLRKYCRAKGIRLIVDITEWYEYKYLPMGVYGLKARDVRITVTRLIPKCDGVIAISSYLEKYFKSREVKNVLRVPIIMDSEAQIAKAEQTCFDPDYLNLIYAGVAGRKDLILNVARAIDNLAGQGLKVKFHVLGTTKESMEKASESVFSDNIVCYGRIDQELVPQYLAGADFSVLVRSDIRNNQAGFPTKFVESLNQGLPVLGNITSDLGLYLKDGYNGYVLEGVTVDAIEDKLRELVVIPRDQFREMRKNAKQTAIDNFDYRSYALPIQLFLSNIK